MANKLLVVVVNTDPESGPDVMEPLTQALAAASMEYDAEVILGGRAGRLALRGVAEQVPLRGGAGRSVLDLMREAHAAGVVFKVAAEVTERLGDNLVGEIAERVGSAYIVSEAMDDETVTFTY